MLSKKAAFWVAGCVVAVSVMGCGFNGGAAGNKVLVAKVGSADGGPQGYVQFDEEDGHRELTVEITGGTPGATLDISVNGVLLLTITLDESGSVHLEFDSEPDEPEESDLPDDFPDADEGDSVNVGDLSGNFEEEEEDEGDDADDDDADDDDEGDDDDDDDSDDDGSGDSDDANDGDDVDDDDGVQDNP